MRLQFRRYDFRFFDIFTCVGGGSHVDLARMNGTGKSKRVVAALVNADVESGRAELRGIARVAHRRGWTLESIDLAYTDSVLTAHWPLLAKADGIILRNGVLLDDGMIGSLGVPVVGIDITCSGSKGEAWDTGAKAALWAVVNNDSGNVARAAAGELLATGRRIMAFIPTLRRNEWGWERWRRFAGVVRKAGREARCYEPATDWDWTAERGVLSKWLSDLPRPFGLFAVNDRLAVLAADACRDAGLVVPRDAAIVGVDDDQTLCRSIDPPLSSVRLDFEGAGRLAAETLDGFFGTSRPRRMRKFAYGVLGVARRASTRCGKAQAKPREGADPRLQTGLDFIARRFGDPYLGVRDVAAAMGVELRQAYRIFAASGRTIRQHVEDARIARIRELLAETDIPVSKVAAECGFASATYFWDFVRRHLGASPTAWRASHRPMGR